MLEFSHERSCIKKQSIIFPKPWHFNGQLSQGWSLMNHLKIIWGYYYSNMKEINQDLTNREVLKHSDANVSALPLLLDRFA